MLPGSYHAHGVQMVCFHALEMGNVRNVTAAVQRWIQCGYMLE
jgi:hypothetical protein